MLSIIFVSFKVLWKINKTKQDAKDYYRCSCILSGQVCEHWMSCTCSFNYIFFIEKDFIYNIILVSGIQHSGSVFLQIMLH